MISVCIATDISLYREGLLHVCTEERGLQVVTTAAHGDDVLRSCKGEHPNVLLLDAVLPGPNTPALLRRLHQKGCQTKVILFGVFSDVNIHAALRLQTEGMLSCRDDAELFVRAAHAVHAGKRFYSNAIVTLSDSVLHPSSLSSSSYRMERLAQILTPTELQIFRAMTQNRTSQEIADSMFISYRTVQKHRSNMVRKLKLSGRNALLAFALEFRNAHP